MVYGKKGLKLWCAVEYLVPGSLVEKHLSWQICKMSLKPLFLGGPQLLHKKSPGSLELISRDSGHENLVEFPGFLSRAETLAVTKKN